MVQNIMKLYRTLYIKRSGEKGLDGVVFISVGHTDHSAWYRGFAQVTHSRAVFMPPCRSENTSFTLARVCALQVN